MLHASTYVTFKWHRSEPVLNSMLRGLLLLKSRRPQWRGLTSPPSPDLSLGRGDTIHLAVKPRREASTKAPLSVSLDIAADQKKPGTKTEGSRRKSPFSSSTCSASPSLAEKRPSRFGIEFGEGFVVLKNPLPLFSCPPGCYSLRPPGKRLRYNSVVGQEENKRVKKCRKKNAGVGERKLVK